MKFPPSNQVQWPRVFAAIVVLLLGVLFLSSQRSQALSDSQQSQNEGKRKISLRSAPPKEVRIVAMRNYEDDEWFNKLEFEIRNESKSDIWYIEFNVLLPEFQRGNEIDAFVMEFGSNSPLTGGIDKPNKPLIHPSESYIFRLPQNQVENLKKRFSPDGIHVPAVGHLQFELYKIYFTDGATFVGGKRVTILPDGSIIQGRQ